MTGNRHKAGSEGRTDRPRPAPSRPAPSRPESAAEARARVEAARRANSEARNAELNRAFESGVTGRAIVGTSVGSTASFVLLTVVTVIWVDQLEAVYLAASFAAFLAGIGLFAVVLLLAAARSRSDAMGIGGLFFLIDCAPRNAFRAMNGSLAAAVVVSVVGAVLRSRTAVIFGTLEPMLPLALSGLWSVRHGHFPPRVDEREPQRGQKKVPGAAGPEDQTPEPQTSEDGPEPS